MTGVSCPSLEYRNARVLPGARPAAVQMSLSGRTPHLLESHPEITVKYSRRTWHFIWPCPCTALCLPAACVTCLSIKGSVQFTLHLLLLLHRQEKGGGQPLALPRALHFLKKRPPPYFDQIPLYFKQDSHWSPCEYSRRFP